MWAALLALFAVVGPLQDGGPPAIGRVAIGGDFACSAVLLEPRRAVTAAHCVDYVIPSAPDAVVSFGGADVVVDAVLLHPDHFRAPEADLAILALASAPAVAPMAWRAVAPDDDWDLWTVGVGGWGATAADGPGGDGLRSFEAAPDDLTESSWLFLGEASVCVGDSGGAVWTEGDAGQELVGVVVGGDPECDGVGEAVRTDAFADFLAHPEDARAGDWPPDDDEDAPSDGPGLTPPPAAGPVAEGGCGGGMAWLVPAVAWPRRRGRR